MIRNLIALIVAVTVQVTGFLFLIGITNESVMIYVGGSIAGLLSGTAFEIISKK